MKHRGWRLPLALPLAALVLVGLVVSLLEGRPERLPGIAIGSAVLLHAERTAALVALVLGVLSVIVEAGRGRLPTQFSTAGLGYAADADFHSDSSTAGLQRQIDDLKAQVARLLRIVESTSAPG